MNPPAQPRSLPRRLPVLDQRDGRGRLVVQYGVDQEPAVAGHSANFTGHALDHNLEVGVLIAGGPTSRRLNEHFHALIANRTLARA